MILTIFLEGQCKNKEQIKKLPKTILFDLFQGIVHGSFDGTFRTKSNHESTIIDYQITNNFLNQIHIAWYLDRVMIE